MTTSIQQSKINLLIEKLDEHPHFLKYDGICKYINFITAVQFMINDDKVCFISHNSKVTLNVQDVEKIIIALHVEVEKQKKDVETYIKDISIDKDICI